MTGCDKSIKNCCDGILLKGDSELKLTTKEDFQEFSEKISKTLKRHEVSA